MTMILMAHLHCMGLQRSCIFLRALAPAASAAVSLMVCLVRRALTEKVVVLNLTLTLTTGASPPSPPSPPPPSSSVPSEDVSSVSRQPRPQDVPISSIQRFVKACTNKHHKQDHNAPQESLNWKK